MAQAFTSYIVDNDRKFRDAIARAVAVTDDLRIPFTLILADFYKSEESIFNLSGPGQYPPFKVNPKTGKSAYEERKTKAWGFSYPLLVRTGRLADSVTDPQSPEAVTMLEKLSLIFGTINPYAIYHQSDDPRTKIPLRKFLFIGPEAPQFATSETTGRPERWMNIMNDFVLKKLKQTGAFQRG